MKNMKNKKVILSSILSLVLCLSLMVGGTFALFTSETKANIAVKAGNVTLNAAIADDSVQTKKWGTGYVDGNAGISPDATVTIDGANITLDNIIPGDGVQFEIAVENTSSIAIQYRTVVENKNGSGLNGLVVTIGGDFYSGELARTEWTAIDKGTQIAIPVTIEFPDAEDNDDYQGAKTELVVRVEAVQGGADTPLDDDQRRAHNDEELAEILSDLNGVEKIYLDGSFGATKLPVGTDGITLMAANAQTTMESLNLNGAKNVTIDGITFDAAKAVPVFDNKAGSNKDTGYTASIYDYRWDGHNFGTGSENVTIKNCIFVGEAAVDSETEKGYTAINMNENGAGTRSANITVVGCEFNCDAVSYIYIQYVRDNTTVTVTDNAFGGDDYSVAWAAVAVQQLNGGSAVITNNTFNTWDAEDSAIKVSTKAGVLNKATAVITGNTFNGAVGDDACVIEIRRSNGANHIVRDNTYNIVDKTIADETTVSTVSGESLTGAVAVWYRDTDK